MSYVVSSLGLQSIRRIESRAFRPNNDATQVATRQAYLLSVVRVVMLQGLACIDQALKLISSLAVTVESYVHRSIVMAVGHRPYKPTVVLQDTTHIERHTVQVNSWQCTCAIASITPGTNQVSAIVFVEVSCYGIGGSAVKTNCLFSGTCSVLFSPLSSYYTL